MEFDDKQDEKEAAFKSAKDDYQGGALIHEAKGIKQLDDLLLVMHSKSLCTPGAIFRSNKSMELIIAEHTRINRLKVVANVDGCEGAQEDHKRFMRTTQEHWLLRACLADEDFVGEAVQLILDGEAGRYFE